MVQTWNVWPSWDVFHSLRSLSSSHTKPIRWVLPGWCLSLQPAQLGEYMTSGRTFPLEKLMLPRDRLMLWWISLCRDLWILHFPHQPLSYWIYSKGNVEQKLRINQPYFLSRSGSCDCYWRAKVYEKWPWVIMLCIRNILWIAQYKAIFQGDCCARVTSQAGRARRASYRSTCSTMQGGEDCKPYTLFTFIAP